MKRHFWMYLAIAVTACLVVILVKNKRTPHYPAPQSAPDYLPYAPTMAPGYSVRLEGAFEANTNKYFTINVEDFGSKYSYKVTQTEAADSVFDPSLAPGNKYGCVIVQASGYVGYYIFSLPDGKAIDRGPEYSACTAWVDDHQVILEEHIYATETYAHYLFNTVTKSKKLLGSYEGRWTSGSSL